MLHTLRITLFLVLSLIVTGGAALAATIMTPSQKTQLEVAVGTAQGRSSPAEIDDLAAARMRQQNGALTACGLTRNLGDDIPFYAFYAENTKTWQVSLARNSNRGAYAVLVACVNAGVKMETWEQMMHPKDASGVRGGNYRVTSAEVDIISRDVGAALALGRAAKISTMRAYSNIQRVKYVCGYAKVGASLIPFTGKYVGTASKGYGRFAVSQIGTSEARIWNVHAKCREFGISL